MTTRLRIISRCASVSILFLMAMTVVGCSARYRATQALAEARLVQPPSTREPLVSDPAVATVVFIRPGEWAGQIVYFDDRNEFLGASLSRSKLVLKITPGPRTIYAATFPHVEATRFLRAHFEAGRIYFVEQAVKPSIAGGNEMFIIAPRNPKTWHQLARWVSSSPTVIADDAGGRAFVQQWAKVISRCREIADNRAPDADEAPLVTVRSDDGFAKAPYWDVAAPARRVRAAHREAGTRAPAPATTGEPRSRGCTSDMECRGDRICEAGRCQVPSASRCSTDADCPPAEICAEQACEGAS